MKKMIQIFFLAILVLAVAASGCLSPDDSSESNTTVNNSSNSSNSTNVTGVVNDTIPH